MSTTDVLIVGAGPTGLVLAYQLRRLGVGFRIIDKNMEPSTTSKAIGLQYRVSEVLSWMGLFDRFLARGVTGAGLNFYVNGQRILGLKLNSLDGTAGTGAFVPQSVALPQNQTEALLIEGLHERGAAVERGMTFIDFTQDRDRVISRVQRADGGEERIELRYLVSCEGAHSLIRKQAGFSFAGKTYPLAFFMADVELDWQASRGEIHVWFHEDGMFSAIPMPGVRTWRLFVEAGKQMPDGATEITLDFVQRLLAERTGDRVTQATNPTWLSEFKISCRMVDHFRNGRVFLAGDAAHVHSPSGGQGITTGVQDAYNLAWKLGMALRGVAPDALLDTYEEERLPIVRKVLAATDQNTNVFFAPTRAHRLLRDRIVLPLLRSARMQNRLFYRMSQLGMHYRGRRLSSHQEGRLLGRARVRAGDRTPDVVFLDAQTGATTSLFACLSRSRLVALLGTRQPSGSAEAARIEGLAAALGRLGVDCYQVVPGGATTGLADIHGDFQRIYGVRGEFLYLIRPDGYVGLFQQPIDERALRAYLGKLYVADQVKRAFASQVPRLSSTDVA